MSAMLTLKQILPWLSGAQLVGDGSTAVSRVHTDTRTIEPGDLFVALKGERFDANDFLQEAKDKGAVAALCHPGASLKGWLRAAVAACANLKQWHDAGEESYPEGPVCARYLAALEAYESEVSNAAA